MGSIVCANTSCSMNIGKNDKYTIRIPDTQCPECKSLGYTEEVFCSKACALSFINDMGEIKLSKVDIKCAHCKKPIGNEEHFELQEPEDACSECNNRYFESRLCCKECLEKYLSKHIGN